MLLFLPFYLSLLNLSSPLSLCVSVNNSSHANDRPANQPTTQYKLRLVASDNLNENHTIVRIHVRDVNDNPPVFDRPKYETQITEEDDRLLPKRILQVMHCFERMQSCVCVCALSECVCVRQRYRSSI